MILKVISTTEALGPKGIGSTAVFELDVDDQSVDLIGAALALTFDKRHVWQIGDKVRVVLERAPE